MTIKRNLISVTGLVFGSAALFIALAHVWAGPFSPPLETLAVDKITAIRESAIAALSGKTSTIVNPISRWNSDKIVDITVSALAIIALMMGIIAGICKENRWGVHAVLFLGMGTLVFQIAMFWGMLILGVVCLVILISVFLNC